MFTYEYTYFTQSRSGGGDHPRWGGEGNLNFVTSQYLQVRTCSFSSGNVRSRRSHRCY